MKHSAVLLAAVAVSTATLAAQTSRPAGRTRPVVTQSIAFAGGAALEVRYEAIAFPASIFAAGPGDADARARAFHTWAARSVVSRVRVAGNIRLAKAAIPAGEYTLGFRLEGESRWSLDLRQRGVATASWPLREKPGSSGVLTLRVAPTEKDDTGALDISFGPLTARLGIHAPTAAEAAAAAVLVKRTELARRHIKQLMDVAQTYMIENPRQIPTWKDLITPDQRGHKWIDSDEPIRDPWGHTYVITSDPKYRQRPFVRSAGPDGKHETADDISNKTTPRRR